MSETIAIASDHAGKELKEELKRYLGERGVEVVDMGTNDSVSVDYPDFGIPVAERVSKGEIGKGILICGTGIGMSIVANKYPKVRAALVHNIFTAQGAKEHNNANILIIGGRIVDNRLAKDMVEVWLNSSFQGGRHQKRLEKIENVEEKLKRKGTV